MTSTYCKIDTFDKRLWHFQNTENIKSIIRNNYHFVTDKTKYDFIQMIQIDMGYIWKIYFALHVVVKRTRNNYISHILKLVEPKH